MDRTASAGENEVLMSFAKSEAEYRNVDLTQTVMERISRLSEARLGGKRRKPLRRSTAAAVLGGAVLLGTLTAYAASDYAHVRYLKGLIDIKAVPAGIPYEYPAEVSKQFEAYRQRVLKMLKPGQMLAYYIHDDKLNAYDKPNEIKFEYDVAFNSYDDYLKKLRQVSAPRLELPHYLPEGYVFKRGQIFPRPPMQSDKDHSVFDKLRQDLLKKAQTATGGDKLVVEPVNWTKVLGANLYLVNGSSILNLLATVGPDDPRQGSKTTIGQRASATSETLRIGHQEVFYMSDDSPEADTPHYLFWYDEQANVYYSIMDSKGSELTRQDILRIAESMIKQYAKKT